MESISRSWLKLVDEIARCASDPSTSPESVTSAEYQPIFPDPRHNTVANVEQTLFVHLLEWERVPAVLTPQHLFLRSALLFEQLLKEPAEDFNFGNNVFLTLEAILRRVERGILKRGQMTEVWVSFALCDWFSDFFGFKNSQILFFSRF